MLARLCRLMVSCCWACAFVVGLTGCYAIRSQTLLQKAQRSFEEARLHPQRINHPYHYRKATLFLNEALRADSRGEYEVSADYAQKALSSALVVVSEKASNAP